MRRAAVLAGLTIFATALGLGLAGCGGPGLDVATWKPAELDGGPARTVRVTSGVGRAEAVDVAARDALDAFAGGGFYHAVDDTRDQLDVDDGRAVLDGGTLQSGSLYVRIDVLEWYAEVSQEARDGEDEYGEPITAIVDVTHAHAVIDATIARGDGTVIADRLELEGIHDEDGDVEDSARDDALEDAVNHVVAQVTPKQTVDFVPFDDRDADQKPILAQAQQGDVHTAVMAEDDVIAQDPARAAPRYNRAVMLDAQNDFAAALAGYDDAAKANPDTKLCQMIADARAACLTRQDAARTVGL